MYEGESSLDLNISFDSDESSKNPSQSPTPSAGREAINSRQYALQQYEEFQ